MGSANCLSTSCHAGYLVKCVVVLNLRSWGGSGVEFAASRPALPCVSASDEPGSGERMPPGRWRTWKSSGHAVNRDMIIKEAGNTAREFPFCWRRSPWGPD